MSIIPTPYMHELYLQRPHIRMSALAHIPTPSHSRSDSSSSTCSSSGSNKSAAASGLSSDCSTLYGSRLILRGFLLFGIGVFFSFVLHLLQLQRSIKIFSPEILGLFWNGWWVPPACGLAAALIGLLYPCVDRKLGALQPYSCEWSSVVRCVALFVGINHATAKIDYSTSTQLSLSLAAMSLGLWYFFDGSRSGLGLCITIALLATAVSQLLVDQGLFRTQDFPYIRSWLPPIFFSGAVTMGLIGRQLAKPDVLLWYKSKTD